MAGSMMDIDTPEGIDQAFACLSIDESAMEVDPPSSLQHLGKRKVHPRTLEVLELEAHLKAADHCIRYLLEHKGHALHFGHSGNLRNQSSAI